MLTTWQDEMKTGNTEIDQQHIELLRKVDDLLQAVSAKKGEEEIARLLWFLKRYVRKHFRDEEKLQLMCGFPDYHVHKMEHDEFFREVKRLEEKFAEEGASTILVLNAVQMMCNWLNDHFHKMDKDLVDFLRQE